MLADHDPYSPIIIYNNIIIDSLLKIHHFAFRRGPNRWRDSFLPKDILDDWITDRGLPPAEWDLKSKPISVTVNGHKYEQSGKANRYNMHNIIFVGG